jgi:hypothetical protein
VQGNFVSFLDQAYQVIGNLIGLTNQR